MWVSGTSCNVSCAIMYPRLTPPLYDDYVRLYVSVSFHIPLVKQLVPASIFLHANSAVSAAVPETSA